jgi:hypothetical protein
MFEMVNNFAKKDEAPPKSKPTKIVSKAYYGCHEESSIRFMNHSVVMDEKGYSPTSQHYSLGAYTTVDFFMFLILMLVSAFVLFIIGAKGWMITAVESLFFLYMIVVKPKGSLVVTYTYKLKTKVKGKLCQNCTKIIKATDKICKHCNHEYDLKKSQV